jgi:hypothetical protein
MMPLIEAAPAWGDNIEPSVSFRLITGAIDGTEPYVCNAGIRHNAVGDFLRFTTAENSAPKYRFGKADYNAQSMVVPPPLDGSVPNYQYYVDVGSPVHTLTFVFASEVQGAEYFLDVCYPPLGFLSAGNPECTAMGLPGTHCSRLQDLVPALHPDRTGIYQQLTQLKFRAAKVGNDACSFTGFPATANEWVNLAPTGYPQGFGWQQSGDAACVIRYIFRESNAVERTWRMQPARFELTAKVPDKPSRNCTLTPGYWKTHGGCQLDSQSGAIVCDGKNYDEVWDAVTYPFEAGKFPSPLYASALASVLPASAFSMNPALPNATQPLHPLVPFMNSGTSWLGLWLTPPSGGNLFTKLAHHWMATTLNLAAGASFELAGPDASSVRNAWLTSATSLWGGGGNNNAAAWLDWFNNGGDGAGFHCSDFIDPTFVVTRKPSH